MKTVFMCENCGLEFDSGADCAEHEVSCKTFIIKECYKCGKTEKIETNNDYEYEADHAIESWHSINLGRQGYGSFMDGCDVDFELYDDCLITLVKSFPIEYQERIYNSGSNLQESSEDWLSRNFGNCIKLSSNPDRK